MIALLVACNGPEPEDEPIFETGFEFDAPAVELPQVVDGAVWVNPAVQPVVQLDIDHDGIDAWVRSIGPTGEVWIEEVAGAADLPAGELGSGSFPLLVQVSGERGFVEKAITLNAGTHGNRVTADAGLTPRLHAVDDALWLTWADGFEGWLQRVDGSGMPIGDPVLLTPAAGDVSSARAAVSASGVGVVYESGGTGWFRAVRTGGDELVAPIEVGPGDVAWDGEAWVVASADGWRRVDPEGAVTGPVAVLGTALAATATASLVVGPGGSALLDPDGAIVWQGDLAAERAFAVGGELVATWVEGSELRVQRFGATGPSGDVEVVATGSAPSEPVLAGDTALWIDAGAVTSDVAAFDHAESPASLHAVDVGGNALIVWTDARGGAYLETLWR